MKIFRKVSDWLFNSTDKFFQGNNPAFEADCPEYPDKFVESNCIVWELKQGVEDIVIKDLQVSIKYIVPAFFRKPFEKAFKEFCLFFLVDAVIEDETLDQKANRASLLNLSPTPAAKKILLSGVHTAIFKSRIIHLEDWLKIKFRKVSLLLSLMQHAKPYYLLGDFTPAIYNNYTDESNFRHTYIFHMRN